MCLMHTMDDEGGHQLGLTFSHGVCIGCSGGDVSGGMVSSNAEVLDQFSGASTGIEVGVAYGRGVSAGYDVGLDEGGSSHSIVVMSQLQRWMFRSVWGWGLVGLW